MELYFCILKIKNAQLKIIEHAFQTRVGLFILVTSIKEKESEAGCSGSVKYNDKLP
ncbi:hypothetical protein EGK38_019995 [Enterobacter hormaechei]|uniref:hypothetical protein n=1 Tax=Enterobacter hormaechei TaxID=158836 RepID=UPI00163ACD40|nr:hypothetical protein [Enterobacter hormaechei]QXR31247.1 hypothetical protein EGK38_019995 [Enterobacter hormaechei]